MNETFQSFGLLWLRVLAGAGIATHGYAKIFGGTMAKFGSSVAKLGLPYPETLAWVAAFSEFGGGILLVIGLMSRLAALFIFATMSVAVFIAHAADPFQVKELALAYWVMSGTIVFTGPGRFSLDARFTKKH